MARACSWSGTPSSANRSIQSARPAAERAAEGRYSTSAPAPAAKSLRIRRGTARIGETVPLRRAQLHGFACIRVLRTVQTERIRPAERTRERLGAPVAAERGRRAPGAPGPCGEPGAVVAAAARRAALCSSGVRTCRRRRRLRRRAGARGCGGRHAAAPCRRAHHRDHRAVRAGGAGARRDRPRRLVGRRTDPLIAQASTWWARPGRSGRRRGASHRACRQRRGA